MCLRYRAWDSLKTELSHGPNIEETRIKDEKIEQEPTEETEENAESLFSLLSPVNTEKGKIRT